MNTLNRLPLAILVALTVSHGSAFGDTSPTNRCCKACNCSPAQSPACCRPVGQWTKSSIPSLWKLLVGKPPACKTCNPPTGVCRPVCNNCQPPSHGRGGPGSIQLPQNLSQGEPEPTPSAAPSPASEMVAVPQVVQTASNDVAPTSIPSTDCSVETGNVLGITLPCAATGGFEGNPPAPLPLSSSPTIPIRDRSSEMKVGQLVTIAQTSARADQRSKAIELLSTRYDVSAHPVIMTALMSRLNDNDNQVRAEAVKRIGDQIVQNRTMATPDIVNALRRATNDADPGIRTKALQTLKQCGFEEILAPSAQVSFDECPPNANVGRAFVRGRQTRCDAVPLAPPLMNGQSQYYCPGQNYTAPPALLPNQLEASSDMPPEPIDTSVKPMAPQPANPPAEPPAPKDIPKKPDSVPPVGMMSPIRQLRTVTAKPMPLPTIPLDSDQFMVPIRSVSNGPAIRQISK